MNGNEVAGIRRHVFWRRLFAWNLGELWLHGEPVALEVWGRLGQARELWTGQRAVPIRALAGFGEGWLLTPELLGRRVDWDELDDDQLSEAAA
jgi:hypothetical protein